MESPRDPKLVLKYEELLEIFQTLDKDNNGKITHAEFIRGLKQNASIANKLGKLVRYEIKKIRKSIGCCHTGATTLT
jgi:Ca2+-binding EF-hand superfamily protein